MVEGRAGKGGEVGDWVYGCGGGGGGGGGRRKTRVQKRDGGGKGVR